MISADNLAGTDQNPSNESAETILKPNVDRDLLATSIRLDLDIIKHPLRTPRNSNTTITSITNFSNILHPPNLHSACRAISSFLNRKPEIAFNPIEDGSPWNYEDLAVYAESGIALDELFFILHRNGIQGFESTIVSPKLALRLAQRGIDYRGFAGKRRQYPIGYEHEQLCCSHHSLVEEEIGELAEFSDRYLSEIYQFRDIGPDESDRIKKMILAKFKESGSRFYEEVIFDKYSAHELLVYLGCSEIQRIIAHIHPSIERVGRTSEELQAIFALRAGVDPLFISGPFNRSTKDGYERGIIQAVIAIPMLRSIARRLNISPDQVSKIFTVGDLYNLISTSKTAKIIYQNPVLRHWSNHNVYPQREVMDVYYTLLHGELMGLLETFTIEGLLNDPHSLHLASQLINKGKYISEYIE